jgi:DNA-directed RNA polymerase II subunit RPB11
MPPLSVRIIINSQALALEDHTLGSMIRNKVDKNKLVLFSGYKVPHPLEHNFEIKIQTKKDTTPHQALNDGLSGLITDMDILENKFTAEVERLRGRNTVSSMW